MSQPINTKPFVNVARFAGVLLLSLFLLVGQAVTASSQPAGGSISLSPTAVETGTSPTLTLTTSGFFDLSEVRPSQVGIRPNQGVSNLKIVSATAQRMVLSFDLSGDASPGTRTLFIKDQRGGTAVALDLVVKRGPNICRPECVPPQVCTNNVCKLPPNVCDPACTSGQVCRNNRCIPDPDFCDPPCNDKTCERCVNRRCVTPRCSPACNSKGTPPTTCECGACVPMR